VIVLLVNTRLRLSRLLNLVQLRRSHDLNLVVLPRVCTGDLLKTRTL